ncbi:hypothetical protein AB1Y20_011231 [Prymnesium parvum]|uniref:RNA helicase n=1 Tax=Prymnesium parvum TaxID=97485 RepID=A0AB34ILZ8_PRYPA|mmetsp:Transcript_8401/g.17498  ORF Transcript_8401/g.17498 Transcript_8401/m.17498 type:complete len:719 (-) Transcript_8401:56-2212(-)|eukprot:CAMPEP_0195566438 /NCGR_PEP_ID=MMETSP0814-20130614/1066_1 /TAXON_ID=97485 /ORGANISM="Prymnesium parvum, Strain Texoma1" /LENGTH=718 /DNA_ID=CAMNT_0040701563 /DNA_START=23 /DNA_END=2179 /DNA_ORIENTATION=-
MSLVYTIEDDEEEVLPESSDDEEFEIGGAAYELEDTSASGKWSTSTASKGIAPRHASKVSTLDEKLRARAAQLGEQKPPPVSEEEQAADVRDKKALKKKAAKRAQPPAAEARDDDADETITRPDENASFAGLQLSKPLLKAINELGYARPTPIQTAVLPRALQGSDICGSAVTGSGKTAAFLLPCLERLLHVPRRIAATRVLVLCPTRELASQCLEMGQQLARFTELRLCLVVGGLSLKMQESEMRTRPDVVIATPGRLIDVLRNCVSVGLELLEVLVLDEADRLLELGFKAEVEEIVAACPRSRQTLLFSATITEEVARLANISLNRPLQVKVDPTNNVAATLQQEFVRLRPQKEHEREALLLSLCTRTYTDRVIIFLSSKVHAHRMKIIFGLVGLHAAELHGNLTQQQRLLALEEFRDGKVDFLLATDLAGRGLDIRGVRVVINFELPTELKAYTHRVGRTARAGSDGRAVSIVSERDRAFLKQVLKHAADVVKTRTIPPEVVAYWVDKIASLEPQIDEVLQGEKEEKAIRLAEMEANKASNLITYRDEIASRPARSWFQTEKERESTRELAKAQQPTSMRASDGRGEEVEKPPAEEKRKKLKRDRFAGMSRKKRRAIQRDEAFAAAVEGDEDGGGRIKVPNQKAVARAAKTQARGMPMVLGKRKMADSAGGPKPKQPKKAPSALEAAVDANRKREKKIPKKLKSHSKPKFAKRRR